MAVYKCTLSRPPAELDLSSLSTYSGIYYPDVYTYSRFLDPCEASVSRDNAQDTKIQYTSPPIFQRKTFSGASFPNVFCHILLPDYCCLHIIPLDFAISQRQKKGYRRQNPWLAQVD